MTRARPGGRGAIAAAAAGLVAAISLAPSGVMASTLPAECADTAGTVTCTYSSGDNTFLVPQGVTSIDVVAVGGSGASASVEAGGAGGAAAKVASSLSVTPGSSLHAVVGGNASGSVGGANGGGAGMGISLGCSSGGGGGASDVRTSADSIDRLLVAAGGGGGGCPGTVANSLVGSGGAGGDATFAGSNGNTPSGATDYGALGGGAGCESAAATECGLGGLGTTTGDPGVLAAGGNAALRASIVYDGAPGGGGGGGYYGGGGSGTGFNSIACVFGGCVALVYGAGGGGGGGSNLVPAGGSASTDATGVPGITISYAEPAPPTAPAVSLDVTSIDFGTALVGTTTASQTVTLTNSGTAALTVSPPTITGMNVTDFRIISNGCANASLAPGEQCQTQVAFHPTVFGNRSSNLRFVDNAADSPQVVALTGFATLPTADLGVRVSAAPGSAKLGRTVRYTITISNLGPAAATGILVSDTLPSQVAFVSASGTLAVCIPAGGGAPVVVSCSVASLASGSSTTIQILATVAASKTTMTDTASVSAATVDPNLANNTATVTSKAH